MEVRCKHVAIFACLALCYCYSADARFVVEQGALQIRFPDAAKKAYPHGFDTSLANFGTPKYVGSIV